MTKHKKQNKFGLFVVLGFIVAIALIVGLISLFKNAKTEPEIAQTVQKQSAPSSNPIGVESSVLQWEQTEAGWQPKGTPPTCASNLSLNMPVKSDNVISVFYPGQMRDGVYKSEGGFKFIDGSNVQKIVAPGSGFLVRGARYLTQGEEQYTFDVMNNCGAMYRLSHLRILTDDFQKIADTWAQPVEGDESSNLQQISPAKPIQQGALIATKVGILATKNSFFSFGVYDYRAQNEASKLADFQAKHQEDKALSWYGTCWLRWLPQTDFNKLLLLPSAVLASGKISDYCK